MQQDTDYGWGILGRLDKGGWIVIEQADVGGRQWRIVRFKMQMNLRILFKTKNFDTMEEMTQYAPAPRESTTGRPFRCCVQALQGNPPGNR